MVFTSHSLRMPLHIYQKQLMEVPVRVQIQLAQVIQQVIQSMLKRNTLTPTQPD